MEDTDVDMGSLPEDVKEKLAELALELSEGDITQKGYEKKKNRLLEPYRKQSESASSAGPSAPSPSTAAQRRAHRRLTREDNRYHSEIRTEAVMQALAMQNKKVPVMPLPSKRTSVNYHGQQQQQQRREMHGTYYSTQHYSQPPDVTSNASKSMRGADRVNRFGQTHASSIRVGVSTNLSTFEEESANTCKAKQR